MRVAKANMKNEGLKQGDVFYFPYLWKVQADKGIADSKERTCCLAFKSMSPSGQRFLVILPISDRKTEGSFIEITEFEKRLAGLDPARPAYVHLDEFNFDPVVGSLVRKGNPVVLGRFSRSFLEHITGALATNIKLKSSRGIDRRS
ncbi:MAG: hypothetical protein K8F90_20065 [Hyphomicrobiales bacterium]|nr:hypothetical protein [Hyphomicrobiales bacterium]